MARGKNNTGILIGVAIAAAVLYEVTRKASAAQASSSGGGIPGLEQQPSTLQPGLPVTWQTAVPAPTTSQVQQASNFWSQLQLVAGPAEGWVNFPSGSQAGASLLQWGMDAQGNYYVQWAGQVYLVGSQDRYGNWPTTLVKAS